MANEEVSISKSLIVELYEIISRFDQVTSEVSPDLLEVVNLCSEKVDEIVEDAGLVEDLTLRQPTKRRRRNSSGAGQSNANGDGGETSTSNNGQSTDPKAKDGQGQGKESQTKKPATVQRRNRRTKPKVSAPRARRTEGTRVRVLYN